MPDVVWRNRGRKQQWREHVEQMHDQKVAKTRKLKIKVHLQRNGSTHRHPNLRKMNRIENHKKIHKKQVHCLSSYILFYFLSILRFSSYRK